MTRQFEFSNRVAFVTGAASGIGRAVANSLAARGCNLALADVDMQGLQETAAMIGNKVRVTRHRLDVADADAVKAIGSDISAAHGRLDILVNNAGVALGGTFEEVTDEEFEWLMNINFWGVVRLTRALLPQLKSSDQAQIVNLSSLFGIVAPPGQTAYCASKFAVRGFSEALRKELAQAGSTVGMTVVHPGGVKTGIARNARQGSGVAGRPDEARRREQFEKMLRLQPERAGEIIVEAIAKRKQRVLVGADARIVSVLERLFPVSYWSLLTRALSGS